jgi:site-specific recombinase XerD
MLRAGIDPKTVSEMLGHEKVEFTMNVYMHITEEMKKDAGEKIDAMIHFIKTRRNAKKG